MRKINFTENQLRIAIKNSSSLSGVLINLSMEINGGNYKTIKKYIDKYKIDTSHFVGLKHNSVNLIIVPIETYLSNKQKINSHKLKLRLIKENILLYQCDNCKLQEWNNKPIPIELHHIDGNKQNNNLSNLQILCPNCHAQTENYAGKSLKKANNKCIDCGEIVQKRSKRCIPCYAKSKNSKYI